VSDKGSDYGDFFGAAPAPPTAPADGGRTAPADRRFGTPAGGGLAAPADPRFGTPSDGRFAAPALPSRFGTLPGEPGASGSVPIQGTPPPPRRSGYADGGSGGQERPPAFLADQPPELVTVSCVLLLVAAATALWLGLTMLTVSSAALGATGGITWRGLLLIVNGVADITLAYYLRRGQSVARILSSLVCAGWMVYWLINTSRASTAFGRLDAGLPSLTGFGMMATAGLMLLVAWAVITGALLWTPSAKDHFRR
jgi:hypothetical protein